MGETNQAVSVRFQRVPEGRFPRIAGDFRRENLERDIAELLPRPVGGPSIRPLVEYKSFLYQAASWEKARRVVAKVEHHQGELFPRVGFIVTNLSLPSRAVVRFFGGGSCRDTKPYHAPRTPGAGPILGALTHVPRGRRARMPASFGGGGYETDGGPEGSGVMGLGGPGGETDGARLSS